MREGFTYLVGIEWEVFQLRNGVERRHAVGDAFHAVEMCAQSDGG